MIGRKSAWWPIEHIVAGAHLRPGAATACASAVPYEQDITSTRSSALAAAACWKSSHPANRALLAAELCLDFSMIPRPILLVVSHPQTRGVYRPVWMPPVDAEVRAAVGNFRCSSDFGSVARHIYKFGIDDACLGASDRAKVPHHRACPMI